MKKCGLAIKLFFLFACTGYAQNILLDPTTTANGGSAGNTLYTDVSTFQINALGVVSYHDNNGAEDWDLTAETITQTGALGKTFTLNWGAMATVNSTQGSDYGKMLTPGGIHRSSVGELGVYGGTNMGISPGEGYYFGLDLSNMDTGVAVQITKIRVRYLNGVGETGVVVSRLDPTKRMVFGNLGTTGIDFSLSNGAGTIDVSSMNLYATGGSANQSLLSIFNNSTIDDEWRIDWIELQIRPNIFFNPSQISDVSHPRLLLKQGEEAALQALIAQSTEFSSIHNYIIEQANTFLSAPALVYNPNSSNRILSISIEAIKQLFYLSYAYRMTQNTSYLTKGEEVLNTVCDFPNWVTYSLDVAEMCTAVAIGYDWMYSGLSSATKQKAREKILNYAFLPQKTQAFWDMTSNWNQVCIGGLTLGALAIYGDGTAQMDQEAVYIIDRILVKNPYALNAYANGNYPEGPMYWNGGTSYEVLMLSALEGIYGQNNDGVNWLTNTPGFLESAKYMQYATGTTSLFFNYSDGTEKRVPLPIAFWMAKKSNDLSILFLEKELMQNGKYASNYSDDSRFLPLALIYGKDISLANLTKPQAKLWYGYGDQPVAMVRTDWQGSNGKYMGVKAGIPTYSHAHMDGGSFVYDAQGMRWAIDFGKEDYEAIKAGISPQGADSDYSQSSTRWDVFRISNISHNTLSIKQATESTWQHHKVNGKATIAEVYDTDAKRGAKIDLKNLIGLNNELNAINRSIYLVNNSSLAIDDYIENGAQPINLYWNMATRALVETLSPSKLKLTQGGKTVVLEVLCSNPAVTFTLAANRSTDPVYYFPTATYERKNTGSVMVGFEAAIPANETVTFTVTLIDGPEVPPSSVQPTNYILLELPNPVTGREANALYSDAAEFHIDAAGKASIAGISTEYAWNVYGNTDITTAMNNKFYFNWQGMATTNTATGPGYGNLLTKAGIDRSASGELGIRGLNGDINVNSNGIDPNEGYRLGLNTLHLPEVLELQLVAVGLNLVTGTKTVDIVNRKDPSKTKTIGGSQSSASIKLPSGLGFVNVEDLDIVLKGGQIDDDWAAVFNSGSASSGGFRISGFVFKLILDAHTLSIQYPESVKTATSKTSREMIVYPNPFTENITLQNINQGKGPVSLKLYTISGTCVLDKTYPTGNITLNLSHISTGVYLLKITDKYGITTVKKLIKQ